MQQQQQQQQQLNKQCLISSHQPLGSVLPGSQKSIHNSTPLFSDLLSYLPSTSNSGLNREPEQGQIFSLPSRLQQMQSSCMMASPSQVHSSQNSAIYYTANSEATFNNGKVSARNENFNNRSEQMSAEFPPTLTPKDVSFQI